MNKVEKFFNDFAELTALGFGLGNKIEKDSDEYIDYFGQIIKLMNIIVENLLLKIRKK